MYLARISIIFLTVLYSVAVEAKDLLTVEDIAKEVENAETKKDMELLLVRLLEIQEQEHMKTIIEFQNGDCQDKELVTNDLGTEYEWLRQKMFERLRTQYCSDDVSK